MIYQTNHNKINQTQPKPAALVFWIGTAVTSGFSGATLMLVVASWSSSTGHPPWEFNREIQSFLGFSLCRGS